jgi:hypothetical protein
MSTKRKKVLLAVALVLVGLFFTNPGLAAHQAALLARENAQLITLGLDAHLMRGQVSQVVTHRIGRTTYGLFSLTTVQDTNAQPGTAKGPRKRTVGLGLLGSVYLWSGI